MAHREDSSSFSDYLRTPSSSPPPRDEPCTPPKRKAIEAPSGDVKPTIKTPKSSKTSSPKTPKSNSDKSNGTWSPEKKGVFMDEIISAGYKSVDLGALADKLGLNKRQLVDQLVPNRSNLRKKAVTGAKGE